MKTRLLSGFAVALAIAFTIAIASDKGDKSTKSQPAKKETKSCCSHVTEAKGCSDEEMMECEPKSEVSTKKKADVKAEAKTKTKSKDGETK